jgi:hypothetical protein
MVGRQHRSGEPHIEDEWCGFMLCKVEQENTPHDHGPLMHRHFHDPSVPHDHRPVAKEAR